MGRRTGLQTCVAATAAEVLLLAAGAKAANSTTNATAIAKAIEILKTGEAGTAVIADRHYSATSHAPNVPNSAFAFVKPTTTVDGQYVPSS